MEKRFPFKRITADDWGISPGVNEGILSLVQKGVVSRVSMLSDAPFLEENLSALLKCPVECGLHFDLTLKNRRGALNPFSKENLLFHLTDSVAFEAEASRQIRLLKSLGIPVSYLDGHEHAHLLPVVSEGVARAMVREGLKTFRNPYSPPLWKTRKFAVNLLSLSGARSFRKRGLASHPCVYPLGAALESADALKRFLSLSPESEAIVHPAVRDDFERLGIEDPYASERVKEYESLLGLLRLV